MKIVDDDTDPVVIIAGCQQVCDVLDLRGCAHGFQQRYRLPLAHPLTVNRHRSQTHR
jgi:hypothetical protein